MYYGTTIDLTKQGLNDKKLYSYQEEATEKLNKYFKLEKLDKPQNGLLVMPTGSGKTFTAVNYLLNSAVSKGYTVIWFAHRKDLIGQAEDTFIKRSHVLLNYGIKTFKIMSISSENYSMSQASGCNVYICSIQSASSKNGIRFIKNMIGKKGKEKLIVVIDEAHHAVMPSFKKIMEKIESLNKNRIFLGLTATPTRMQEAEQIRLYKMFDCFTDIKKMKEETPRFIYEVKLKDLIADGALANPEYYKIETNLQENVKFDIREEDEKHYKKYGELSEYVKEQVAKSSYRNKIIVDEYIKNREKYGKTLIFAVNKIHAKTLDAEFKKISKEKNLNIKSEYCISGDGNNQEKINNFKSGKYNVFINVQILTEGSDVPDIQTVFLTRQTNSDSLLMQMIGRGLRGKSAGGTETLNVVDFHDTWDKFKFWLDPEHIINGLKGGKGEGGSSNNPIVEIPWDMILEIYTNMVANVTGKSTKPIVPAGWYNVVDNNGNDNRLIVYDNQLTAYHDIEAYLSQINEKTDSNDLIRKYFILQNSIPPVKNIKQIIDYINENKKMPEYYEFTELKVANSATIANYIIEEDMGSKSRDKYLFKLYDTSDVFRQIYRSKDNFKKAIRSEMARIEDDYQPQTVEYLDEREEYSIEENYFDLENLLNEVIKEVEEKGLFEPNKSVNIEYSRKPVKRWFGLCTKYPDGRYTIRINKLLSSPKVNEDVIKYLIYHELLHASGYWSHDSDFRNLEWKYENSEKYDTFLDRLSMDYNIEALEKDLEISVKEACISSERTIINTTHNKISGYRKITEDSMCKINKVIKEKQILKPIDLEFPKIKTKVHIGAISENIDLGNNDYSMNLLNKSGDLNSLHIGKEKFYLSIEVCNSSSSNIYTNGVCISMGSNCSRLGNWFARIELTQALEDEEYIYILKNISKIGGRGSINRLNNGLGANKIKKHKRREVLVRNFGAETIHYNNNDWMIVSKICKNDLNNDNTCKDVLYNFIKDFVRYAFLIEEIISD